jgi:aminopeptidase-like protein
MSIKNYYNLARHILFPICRSITGHGTRETLKTIKNEFPQLKIHHVNSGTKVFDWKVPPEWNIRNAYILDKKGTKVIDFKKNNLHLVNYSIPVNKILRKREVLKRIHINTKILNAIPYITSYYKKYWGFCCTYYEKKKIQENYEEEANDVQNERINQEAPKFKPTNRVRGKKNTFYRNY